MAIFRLRYLKFLLIPIIAFGAYKLYLLRSQELSKVPAAIPAPWAVHTALVGHGAVHDAFPALGKVVSATDLHLAPQIAGTVLAMGPRAGGAVKKGSLLLELDTREINANLGALTSQLLSAKATARNDTRELAREQQLLKTGGSSASAVEQRQTRLSGDQGKVHALNDQIKALKVKKSYGRILAPIDAVVVQRMAEPGDTVFPGKSVYVLSAKDGGRVIVPVPLSTLTRTKAGGKVQLILGQQSRMVRISRINPALDAQSMGSLEIDLSERPFGLPDGARIPAWVIQSETRHSLIVPIDALLPGQDDNQRAVFKINPGHPATLTRVAVQVELCGTEGCAVRGKLQQGDQVVRAHESVLLKLQDKEAVTVASAEVRS